jgi:hypothetical protein
MEESAMGRIMRRRSRRPALALLLSLLTTLPSLLYAGSGAGVVVNRLGTSGACISFAQGAVIEVVPGTTSRYQYCFNSTVKARCVWTPPSAADTGPATNPSSTVGYPVAANTDYCEDARQFGYRALQSRVDCYNSDSSSGSICTREEQ